MPLNTSQYRSVKKKQGVPRVPLGQNSFIVITDYPYTHNSLDGYKSERMDGDASSRDGVPLRTLRSGATRPSHVHANLLYTYTRR
jgi:hypothetical protein